jgi:hypothetical protein
MALETVTEVWLQPAKAAETEMACHRKQERGIGARRRNWIPVFCNQALTGKSQQIAKGNQLSTEHSPSV